MADDLSFDPSKKKKKKKKVVIDVDDNDASTEGAASSITENNSNIAETPDKDDVKTQLDSDDLTLDFSGKKKKKKKKVLDSEEAVEDAVNVDKTINEETPTADIDEMNFDPTLMKKKKKKKKNLDVDDDSAKLDEVDSNFITDDQNEINGSRGWLNSDREYTYEELLARVFDIMREKNPDMIAGEKRRFIMRPPQVVKVGTKKTSFVNFSEICKMVHRQPKHVQAYLCAELGANGSVDGNNQLIIKGKFQQKQIENILRSYIKEYVTCHTCRSPETMLQKDTRLYFLQCESCGSRCSVANIKSGFQAVTGKRAALRAKTT